ncbi:MAG: DUF5691 domain-containing protein [Chloroflexota bacterium]|nr:DUF5691 domain-containing protein [Chloroflexota bacterium]
MSDWMDLAKTALLGTSRAPLPPCSLSGAAIASLLSQVVERGPERRLLSAAALLKTWEQAGFVPPPGHAPLAEPAPPDDRPACPSHAAQHLAQMLQGDMRPVLEGWLGALAASGRSLPHRWLPELLDLACQKSDLRSLILPLLDARGRWLAAQHETWQKLIVPFEPEALNDVWETGSRQARLTLLHHLRAADPAQVPELLNATWGQEPAKDRAAFLATLSTGLSAADEPFLESALDDRSKQVRAVTADLLARLPGSQLVERTQARLRPLLSLERRLLGQSRLQVSLPEAYSQEMARDGIEEKPPSGLGQRAWWLLQMIAIVPPSTWSQAWGQSPGKLVNLIGETNPPRNREIKAAPMWRADGTRMSIAYTPRESRSSHKTEHGAVLLEGWSQATARHRDGEWAEALLKRWADNPWKVLSSQNAFFSSEGLSDLVLAVPQERLEGWLTSLLRAQRRSLDEAGELLTVLLHHRRPWGASLASAVLSGLYVLAAKPKPTPATWRWRSALDDFARYVPPDLVDKAEKGWPAESVWTKNVDRFLTILHFRRAMLQSLR